jgi:hypothetical protein
LRHVQRAGPKLNECRQGERDDDQPKKGMEERPDLDHGGGLSAQEESEIERQQGYLQEEKDGCRGQKQLCVGATEMGERHHIVDAGREQHQQDAQSEQRIARHHLEQYADEERNCYKV